MRIQLKWLVGLLLIALVCFTGLAEAGWKDYRTLDRVLMGGAWKGHTAQTVMSLNVLTYNGPAFEGELRKLELSLDLGILGYEHLEFDSGEINVIANVNINMIEASKMFPAIGLLADFIPNWCYVGAGYSANVADEEWIFEPKLVAAVRVDLGK